MPRILCPLPSSLLQETKVLCCFCPRDQHGTGRGMGLGRGNGDHPSQSLTGCPTEAQSDHPQRQPALLDVFHGMIGGHLGFPVAPITDKAEVN